MQANNLWITVDVREQQLDIHALKAILKPQCDEEGLSVMIHTQTQGASADVRLGFDWRVLPSDQMIEQLKQINVVRGIEVL